MPHFTVSNAPRVMTLRGAAKKSPKFGEKSSNSSARPLRESVMFKLKNVSIHELDKRPAKSR
ncbi:MAG TPA: hypothetical protein VFM56_09960 [Solimonas sp.]|nr:hypothetical protein [Solimonas sp.]